MPTQLLLEDSTGALVPLGAKNPLPASGIGTPSKTSFQSTQGITVATDVVGQAAAGAGLRNYVTDLMLSNSSATPALVVIKDGATPIWQCSVPAGVNIMVDLLTPIKSSANAAININVGTAVTTMYVSLSGFTGV